MAQDVVETLTSNRADHPFDQWILPRGARCGKDLLDPETVDASVEVRSVGGRVQKTQTNSKILAPLQRDQQAAIVYLLEENRILEI